MSDFNARRRQQLEAEAQQEARNRHNRRVLSEMKKNTETTTAATPSAPPQGRLSEADLIARIERLNRSVERITALMKELRGEVELSSTDKGVTR
jgi:hypothetical protein